jgi:hypothetical protein
VVVHADALDRINSSQSTTLIFGGAVNRRRRQFRSIIFRGACRISLFIFTPIRAWNAPEFDG